MLSPKSPSSSSKHFVEYDVIAKKCRSPKKKTPFFLPFFSSLAMASFLFYFFLFLFFFFFVVCCLLRACIKRRNGFLPNLALHSHVRIQCRRESLRNHRKAMVLTALAGYIAFQYRLVSTPNHQGAVIVLNKSGMRCAAAFL